MISGLTHQKHGQIESGGHIGAAVQRQCEGPVWRGPGRNPGSFIPEELNPLLRGWTNCFDLSEVKGVFEELDGWIRRKPRCVQWKRPWTR